MQKIKVRTIKGPNLLGSFSISKLDNLLAEKDMIEKIHRHGFFFVLAMEKGNGEHQIDFTNYAINDYSIFILRPGQSTSTIIEERK